MVPKRWRVTIFRWRRRRVLNPSPLAREVDVAVGALGHLPDDRLPSCARSAYAVAPASGGDQRVGRRVRDAPTRWSSRTSASPHAPLSRASVRCAGRPRRPTGRSSSKASRRAFLFRRSGAEDASARAWVVAWTPRARRARAQADQPARCCCSSFASFGSARRRRDASVRRVGFVASGPAWPRVFRRACDWPPRARVARPQAQSRGVNPGTSHAALPHRASSRRFSKTARTLRTAFAVETRRVARLFAASMSMPSKPSVAFS